MDFRISSIFRANYERFTYRGNCEKMPLCSPFGELVGSPVLKHLSRSSSWLGNSAPVLLINNNLHRYRELSDITESTHRNIICKKAYNAIGIKICVCTYVSSKTFSIFLFIHRNVFHRMINSLLKSGIPTVDGKQM